TGQRPRPLPRTGVELGEDRIDLVDLLHISRFPRLLAPDRRFSFTLRLAKMRRPSGDMEIPRPTRLWADRCVIRSPSKSTSPAVTLVPDPRMVFIRVERPAPLAPTIPTHSPCSTVRSTSKRTGSRP